MIVSIGMADRNSVALKFADELAEINSPVSFLGPFTQNEESLNLLNYVIDRCILFDPVFCNTDGNVHDITKQRLIQAFSVNSDIEFVCVEESCYVDPLVKQAVDEAVEQVGARFRVLKENDDLKALAKELSALDKYEN